MRTDAGGGWLSSVAFESMAPAAHGPGPCPTAGTPVTPTPLTVGIICSTWPFGPQALAIGRPPDLERTRRRPLDEAPQQAREARSSADWRRIHSAIARLQQLRDLLGPSPLLEHELENTWDATLIACDPERSTAAARGG